MCDRVQWHDEVLDDLTQKDLMGRLDCIESEFGTFTGGLNDIIDGRRKREYTEQIRSTRPEFGRYESIGKKMGLDVYDTVADKTFSMPEEEREGAIMAMLDELKEKFDDILAAMEAQVLQRKGCPEPHRAQFPYPRADQQSSGLW